MTIGQVATRDMKKVFSWHNIRALRRKETLGQVLLPLGRGLFFERNTDG